MEQTIIVIIIIIIYMYNYIIQSTVYYLEQDVHRLNW